MKKTTILFIVLGITAGAIVFYSGWALGKSTLNAPKTVIHHVTLKWKEGTTDPDKKKALDGLYEIASNTPGALNIWTRSVKVQPREYSQSFVIEFESEAALKAYGEHPKKKEWDDFYYNIRESSYNNVTTN